MGSLGRFRSIVVLDHDGLCLPLWIPFVALIAPTLILWVVDHRRRPLPGHCRKCNYNLTGNTSGVCPECGNEIETPAANRSAT